MSRILESGRTFIIGEIAQAHDGSLGMAHAYIDAIAAAGADAIKFQTHIASAESTPAEQWRVKFSYQDDTRYEYWKRMEFTEAQWHGLKKHSDEAGIQFLSSPFSIEAVELLTRVGMPAWKIASGEVSNAVMIEAMAGTRWPILLSSGMSDWAELDDAVSHLRGLNIPYAVMQCTTAYPCPPEKIGLNLMEEMRKRYGCPVGLSDHSGTIYPGLAAAAAGAELLEVHVTMSREMFGPDVKASVTTGELRQLTDGIRFIEKMRASPLDKDTMAKESAPLRKMFTKSIVAATDLPADTLLTAEHLALKKPGSGLPPGELASVVGRHLARPVTRDQQILPEDLR